LRTPAIQNKLGEAFFHLIEMILFEKGLRSSAEFAIH
jgi:hypothetical protein